MYIRTRRGGAPLTFSCAFDSFSFVYKDQPDTIEPSASDTKETADANLLPRSHSSIALFLSRSLPVESVRVYLKRKAWTDFALWMDGCECSVDGMFRRRFEGGAVHVAFAGNLGQGREPVLGGLGSRFSTALTQLDCGRRGHSSRFGWVFPRHCGFSRVD